MRGQEGKTQGNIVCFTGSCECVGYRRRKSRDNEKARLTHLATCGDHITGEPPVLIPNTEVKPCRAGSTGLDTDREIRTLPHFFIPQQLSGSSTRLLTEVSQVRILPGEPRKKQVERLAFFYPIRRIGMESPAGCMESVAKRRHGITRQRVFLLRIDYIHHSVMIPYKPSP